MKLFYKEKKFLYFYKVKKKQFKRKNIFHSLKKKINNYKVNFFFHFVFIVYCSRIMYNLLYSFIQHWKKNTICRYCSLSYYKLIFINIMYFTGCILWKKNFPVIKKRYTLYTRSIFFLILKLDASWVRLMTNDFTTFTHWNHELLLNTLMIYWKVFLSFLFL